MKITKQYLKQVIKEEMQRVINENYNKEEYEQFFNSRHPEAQKDRIEKETQNILTYYPGALTFFDVNENRETRQTNGSYAYMIGNKKYEHTFNIYEMDSLQNALNVLNRRKIYLPRTLNLRNVYYKQNGRDMPQAIEKYVEPDLGSYEDELKSFRRNFKFAAFLLDTKRIDLDKLNFAVRNK